MKRNTKIFLAIYTPLLLVTFLLTIDIVNPISFPTINMQALNLLPMLGIVLLLIGTLAGSGVLYVMEGQRSAKIFGCVSLIATIVIAIITCNLFRKPLLERVGERAGKRKAEKLIASGAKYKRCTPTLRNEFPHLHMFLNGSRDEILLHTGFMRAYKETLQEENMADLEALRAQGEQHGYKHGQAAGRNAGSRGDPQTVEPLRQSFVERMRTDNFDAYVDGFEAGYEKGWLAGYQERQK